MKYKILEMLQESDGFVSGGLLSEKLGISRSAVWKHIKNLRKCGIAVTSVPSKGYMLTSAPDKINPRYIEEKTAKKVYYFPSVSSTNAIAKSTTDAPDKSIFIAENQTAGRGRLGRSWVSRGNGIWMSLFLKPNIPACEVSKLTLIAGMAVCRAIEGSVIKWPNDVLLGTRKVSGILTEMSAELDRVDYVVVGIGINVNARTFGVELIEKATSLYIETGKIFDRNDLVCKVVSEFDHLYDEFLNSGFSALKKEYKKKCVTLGRDIIILKNGEEINARAVDINDGGELIAYADGRKITLNSGEVSVRGLLGYGF